MLGAHHGHHHLVRDQVGMVKAYARLSDYVISAPAAIVSIDRYVFRWLASLRQDACVHLQYSSPLVVELVADLVESVRTVRADHHLRLRFFLTTESEQCAT